MVVSYFLGYPVY